MDERGEFVAALIDRGAGAYAAGAVERQLTMQPGVLQTYGDGDIEDLRGDSTSWLRYLAEALAAGCPELLWEHIRWLKVATVSRQLPVEHVGANLGCLAEELAASLPNDHQEPAVSWLIEAASVLERAPGTLPSYLDGPPDSRWLDLARRFLLAALEGRGRDAADSVMLAFANGASLEELSRDVLMRVQREVGRMWQMGEINVAEERVVTRTTQQVLAQMRERVPRSEGRGQRILCAAVGGDLHDLGIQVVADHLELCGWDVLSLGPSMPAVDLVHSVRDFEADLVALSASSALQVRATASTIRVLRRHGGPDPVPVLVGGGPFGRIDDLWQRVGAAGGACDVPGAIRQVELLLA
ncbi:MAG: cobalamin-dependent protein [Planctomycetota bacterium]